MRKSAGAAREGAEKHRARRSVVVDELPRRNQVQKMRLRTLLSTSKIEARRNDIPRPPALHKILIYQRNTAVNALLI